MSLPFASVLTHPVNMDYRQDGMGPPGSHVNQFADRAPAFPDLMGADGGWVPGMTGHYEWVTNGSATYHCSQTLLDFVDGDTGAEQIIFGRTEPRCFPLETEKRMHGQQLFGLSQLNYMMQHDVAYRRLYGGMRNSAELLKHWNYKGVQRIKQTHIADMGFNGGQSRGYSTENAFTIFGRARLPNIWLAVNKNKGHLSEGMHCHILVRRHRYVANAASRAASWQPASARVAPPAAAAASGTKPDPSFDMMDMWPGFDKDECDAVPTATFGEKVTRMDMGTEFVTEDEPGTEYYWSFDPWVSNTGTNPDPEMYINRNGIGTYQPIGMVHHSLKGDNNHAPGKAAMAQRAIYPNERGTAYQIDLYKLDAIELHLGVGNKRT